MWQGIIICYQLIAATLNLKQSLLMFLSMDCSELEYISHLTAEPCSPAILKEEIPRVLLTEWISGVSQASASAGMNFKQGLCVGTPGMYSHHSGCDEELLLSSSELFPL